MYMNWFFIKQISQNLPRNLFINLSTEKICRLFTEHREKERWEREKPDRFSIISADRKTIANDPRMYRRPTNGLRSPGTGMSWDSACTESQIEINERQAETGLSSSIPREMFIEDFMEKATGRCVRNQMGFMTQTARPVRYIQGGKIARCTTKSGRKSVCFRKSKVHPCCQEFNVRRNSLKISLKRARLLTEWRVYIYISHRIAVLWFWRFYYKYHPSPDTIH